MCVLLWLTPILGWWTLKNHSSQKISKPKGKTEGKGKGKVTEEPGVTKLKGKKPKKTEDIQEQPGTSRSRILGFAECLPSLTEPYLPTSASALAVMAWGVPAEFFALDMQGLPTPNSRTYKVVRFPPVDSLNTIELRHEQVELENWDEMLVHSYQQACQNCLDALSCIC
ncbi:hypothetical protein H0H81_012124 [Sphagnurus paluster]|uniref:Uncharacterized protein n=1 Tax=Sphagnurus paluster TaxID=117069 RepID=A0A9P7FTR1_9AGAR|nr:hypothetical protein H0H81_012124 [Sphagnurus paluster]